MYMLIKCAERTESKKKNIVNIDLNVMLRLKLQQNLEEMLSKAEASNGDVGELHRRRSLPNSPSKATSDIALLVTHSRT